MTDKQRILILCTGNSARSQMAEAWIRAKGNSRYEVHSAGSRPSGYVHPDAITAMAELGIDLSGHHSKSMTEFLGMTFDYVVTVCDNAAEECPVFPGKGRRIHHGFNDPAAAPEAIRLDEFRRVRDEIITWLNELFELTT